MDGLIWLGSNGAVSGPAAFESIEAASGAKRGIHFGEAGPAEVKKACDAAAATFDAYRATTPEIRAAFLEEIAAQILALGDALIEAACVESSLPRGRTHPATTAPS